jgi:PAS domain S-box-containing protein
MITADWQNTPLTLPLLLIGLLCAWVAHVSWRRRTVPEAAPFALLMAAIAGWTLLSLVEKSLVRYEPRRAVSTAVYLFIVTTPAAWLAFAVCFARLDSPRLRRAWPLLAVEPALVLALVLTDAHHSLFRTRTVLGTDGPYVVLTCTYGPLFWVHAAYTYTLFAAGAVLVIRGAARRSSPPGQLAVLISGMAVPALGNVAYVFRLQPARLGDLTPVYFAVSGLGAAVVLFRFRLFDILPLARGFILDNLHDPVFVLDLKYRILDLNPAAAALLPQPPGGVRHRPLADVLPALGRCLALPTSTGEINTELRLDVNGKERFWEVQVRPLADYQAPLGVLVRLSDITGRKQAGEALKEADRRKDEFLALLAHELRNPLTPLRNALHVLQRPDGPGVPFREVCHLMERQVEHLVRLVDDLLDVSRITRGRLELHRAPAELAAAVARAVETTRPLIEAGGHELTVSLPPERLLLEADLVRLAQVFANLLHNAAKYTERGGHLWLTAEREGDEAVVRVRDTGIGIAPEMLPRIFDLFVQADRSLARSQGGMGIGLTLVRTLVEMHGGSVRAASAGPGRGSEFVVRLPLLRDGSGRTTAAKGLAPSSFLAHPSRRRILVVDDNADTAESLALLLRREGHEVHVAHDGVAGLQAAQTDRPDIVFLDIGMPGMDGYEVARRLRRQPGLRGVVLVALTGWGQEEDRERARRAGFDHHLTKPAAPETLQQLLNDLPPSERSQERGPASE